MTPRASSSSSSADASASTILLTIPSRKSLRYHYCHRLGGIFDGCALRRDGRQFQNYFTQINIERDIHTQKDSAKCLEQKATRVRPALSSRAKAGYFNCSDANFIFGGRGITSTDYFLLPDIASKNIERLREREREKASERARSRSTRKGYSSTERTNQPTN